MLKGNTAKNKTDVRKNLQHFEMRIATFPHLIELGHSAKRRIVSLFSSAPLYFFSCRRNVRPAVCLCGLRESALKSSTIQSAPALRSSSSAEVVRNPSTRAPAALPERTPETASSATRQSAGEIPRTSAPF